MADIDALIESSDFGAETYYACCNCGREHRVWGVVLVHGLWACRERWVCRQVARKLNTEQKSPAASSLSSRARTRRTRPAPVALPTRPDAPPLRSGPRLPYAPPASAPPTAEAIAMRETLRQRARARR